MQIAINALASELRRLKAAGVKHVPVSEASLSALRHAVAGRRVEVSVADRAMVAAPVSPEPSRPAPASPPLRPAAVVEPRKVTAVQLPSAPAFTLPEGDKAHRWSALRELVLNDPHCRAQVRAGKKVVLGVGSLDAKIMFVGEAPGAEEEIQGEPFVGPAGQLLTKMIQGMGVKRGDVYIGNIMNWRPQLPLVAGQEPVGNRPPTEEEMTYCLPFLRAQVDIVNPVILVALGKTAAHGLLGFGTFEALGEVRGKWHEFARRPLMVTYHPSYILRNPSNRAKRMIWEDFLQVMTRVGLPISEKQQAYFLDK